MTMAITALYLSHFVPASIQPKRDAQGQGAREGGWSCPFFIIPLILIICFLEKVAGLYVDCQGTVTAYLPEEEDRSRDGRLRGGKRRRG